MIVRCEMHRSSKVKLATFLHRILLLNVLNGPPRAATRCDPSKPGQILKEPCCCAVGSASRSPFTMGAISCRNRAALLIMIATAATVHAFFPSILAPTAHRRKPGFQIRAAPRLRVDTLSRCTMLESYIDPFSHKVQSLRTSTGELVFAFGACSLPWPESVSRDDAPVALNLNSSPTVKNAVCFFCACKLLAHDRHGRLG